jgi:hypothetical protein
VGARLVDDTLASLVITRDDFFHLQGGLRPWRTTNTRTTILFFWFRHGLFFLLAFVSFRLARFNCKPASTCIFSLFSPGEQGFGDGGSGV